MFSPITSAILSVCVGSILPVYIPSDTAITPSPNANTNAPATVPFTISPAIGKPFANVTTCFAAKVIADEPIIAFTISFDIFTP